MRLALVLLLGTVAAGNASLSLSLSDLLPACFGVYYNVIGTAHFAGFTFRVLEGRWIADKTEYLDDFDSSSTGPVSFSPSRNTYLWLGYNEEEYEQPYAYAIDPVNHSHVLSFPAGTVADWRGVLAVNGTAEGLFAVHGNGTIVSIANGTVPIHIPELNATDPRTDFITASSKGFTWVARESILVRIQTATNNWTYTKYSVPSIWPWDKHKVLAVAAPGASILALVASQADKDAQLMVHRLGPGARVMGSFAPIPSGGLVMGAALDKTGQWAVLDTNQGFLASIKDKDSLPGTLRMGPSPSGA